MSYNSKYTGQEVETLLDKVGAKQDKIDDLDTIRSGAALGATALQSVPNEYATKTDLANKVDVIDGKQLSTEDFTTALKTKLEGLTNYDDNDIKSQIELKQDKIQDLDSIRDGANKGATALQSYTETDPVFSSSVAAGIQSSDISNWNGKKNKPSIESHSNASLSLVPSPNTIYNCTTTLTDITISSFNTTSEAYEEYMVLFKSGDATTLTLPSDVYWANGEQPEVEADTEYELSVSKRSIDGINIFKAILVPFKTIA